MKRRLLASAALILLSVAGAMAQAQQQQQEGAVPSNEGFDPALDQPLPLLPDAATEADAAYWSTDGAPQGTPVKETAERLREAIRVRELKTLSLREAPIQEQKALARNAKTPEGRRTALRNYYTLLARSILAKDPKLKELVEADLALKLRSLEQRRVGSAPLIEPIPVVPGSRPSLGQEVIEPEAHPGETPRPSDRRRPR